MDGTIFNESEPATIISDCRKRGSRPCDVILTCRGNEFDAHKSVLMAASPYFRDILIDEEYEGKIEKVCLDELQPEGLVQILEYVYNDRLTVSIDNVQCVMSAAIKLSMNFIYKKCIFLLKSQLNVDYFLQTWNIADSFSDNDLQTAVVNFCANNYHRLRNLKTFLTLPKERMQMVLKHDQLRATCDQIVETVIEWIRCAQLENQDQVTQLLYILRSDTASKNFLLRLQDDDNLLKASPALRELLIVAIQSRQLKNIRVAQDQLTFSDDCTNLVNIDMSNPFLLAFVETEKRHTVVLKVELRSDATCMKSDFSPFHIRHTGNVMFANRLYCAGGKNESDNFLSTFHEFDYNVNEMNALTPMTIGRAQLSLAVYENNIYAIGGYNSRGELTDVERYSISEESWTIVTSMAIARRGLATTSFLGKLYAIGGRKDKETLSVVEYYTSESDQWTQICSLPYPRTNCVITTLNDNLYVLGGFWTFQEFKNSCVGQIQRLNVTEERWYLEKSLQSADLITCAFSWQEKIVFITGFGLVYSYTPSDRMLRRVCTVPCSKGLLRRGFLVSSGSINSDGVQSKSMWSNGNFSPPDEKSCDEETQL